MKYNNNFLIFALFKRSMLLSIFKIFDIVLTIYTNIVIIFYVEYHREYKFLYSIFQASYYEGSTGRFGENPTRQSILHVFPLPFTCFCFGDFLTFFTWQPSFFFLVYDWFSFSPFFSSSHPKLSFVQVSKQEPSWKIGDRITTHSRGFEPESWHVCSQLRYNHIAIASHILTLTFNAFLFVKI